MTEFKVNMIFGNLTVHDLEILERETRLQEFNPYKIKNILWSLEVEPVETTRTSTTAGRALSHGRGIAFPESESESEGESVTIGENAGMAAGLQHHQGRSMALHRARTMADGISHITTDGVADTELAGESYMSGFAQNSSVMDAHGMGANSADSSGMSMTWDPYTPGAATMIPNSMTTSRNAMDGTNVNDVHADSSGENAFEASGYSHMHGTSISHAEADAISHLEALTEGESAGLMESFGTHVVRSCGTSREESVSTTRTVSRGVTPSFSEEQSVSASETTQPFHELHKRYVPSSVEFLSREEHAIQNIQEMKAQTVGHFMLAVPGKAVFIRAPWVEKPEITRKTLARGLARVYALPQYTRINALDAHAAQTEAHFHRALSAPAALIEEDDFDCWGTEKPTI